MNDFPPTLAFFVGSNGTVVYEFWVNEAAVSLANKVAHDSVAQSIF
jgi:hypothetical protein